MNRRFAWRMIVGPCALGHATPVAAGRRKLVANDESMSIRRRKRSRSLSEFYNMATEAGGRPRILLVLLLIALACVIIFAGVSIEHQAAVDNCLDVGGRWNAEAEACERG